MLLACAGGVAAASPKDDSAIQGWRLQGLFSNGASGSGWALIDLGDGASLRVRDGDSLPGETRLLAVYRDHAVLEKGTRQITLRFSQAVAADAIAEVGSVAGTSPPVASDGERCSQLLERGAEPGELAALGFCAQSAGLSAHR